VECYPEGDRRVTAPMEVLSYLRNVLAQRDTYAVVTQDRNGNITLSAEIGAGAGDLEVAALIGPEGPSGADQFVLRPQLEVYSTPELLTDEQADLTNTNADIGKYWLIDQTDVDGNVLLSAAFIWFGTEFRYLPFGTQGPPGTYPVIAPSVNLLAPDENSLVDDVTGSGTAADPYIWNLELSIPQGPFGPSASLASMPDVAEATPPTVGQFLGYQGNTFDGNPVWQPTDAGEIIPRPYTIPTNAFNSFSGIDFGSTITVAAFTVPANPFPWKPVVFGLIEMFEIELSFQPLLIGAEVMLNSPTGQVVARGFGNTVGGIIPLIPHCSTPASPTTAMTPSNSTALVAANTPATLYVNLVNDGIVALYDFNANNAQLFVMAVAVSGQTATVVPGALRAKVTLSAQTITLGS
jgi:hypothetical protein